VIHSRHRRHKCAAPSPLAAEVRGRFSLPAAGFRAIAPIILAIALLITSARSLAILGPSFQATLSASSRPRGQPDQAAQGQAAARHVDGLSPVFTPEVQRWAPSIRRWSVEYGVPGDLIAVVMQIESCGDPLAVSPSGAIGLFQVMPFHFSPEDDPFDTETNAGKGLRYLAGALSQASNDPRLALAGYNGGHGVIGLPDAQWAAETQRYVDYGLGILKDAGAGLTSSPTLEVWLASGGSSLCRQAAHRGPELLRAAIQDPRG
jgi:hypothetical protein